MAGNSERLERLGKDVEERAKLYIDSLSEFEKELKFRNHVVDECGTDAVNKACGHVIDIAKHVKSKNLDVTILAQEHVINDMKRDTPGRGKRGADSGIGSGAFGSVNMEPKEGVQEEGECRGEVEVPVSPEPNGNNLIAHCSDQRSLTLPTGGYSEA